MRKLIVLATLLLSLTALAGDGGAPAKKQKPDGAAATITCGQLRNLCSGLCHSDMTCFSQCMAGHGC